MKEVKQVKEENLHKKFWKCDICESKFESKKTLDIHKETLHGELRKQKCNLCGKIIKWYLSRHIREVHGENNKTYECKQCEKYSNKLSMKALVEKTL